MPESVSSSYEYSAIATNQIIILSFTINNKCIKNKEKAFCCHIYEFKCLFVLFVLS